MDYTECSDSELFSLICEEDESAKDALFMKYNYIIDLIIKKYAFSAMKYGIEYKDLYQEALVGYADAIKCYSDDKDAGMASFITLCVERRLQNVVRKAGRLKNKMFLESLSLDYFYDKYGTELKELLSDNNQNNPYLNITKDEDYEQLLKCIEKTLSVGEYEVYKLLVNGFNSNDIAEILKKNPKQIDNAIQRIKTKVKEILNRRENI
jgi:RNA polymerase sporulation-specific sigma factor